MNIAVVFTQKTSYELACLNSDLLLDLGVFPDVTREKLNRGMPASAE